MRRQSAKTCTKFYGRQSSSHTPARRRTSRPGGWRRAQCAHRPSTRRAQPCTPPGATSLSRPLRRCNPRYATRPHTRKLPATPRKPHASPHSARARSSRHLTPRPWAPQPGWRPLREDASGAVTPCHQRTASLSRLPCCLPCVHCCPSLRLRRLPCFPASHPGPSPPPSLPCASPEASNHSTRFTSSRNAVAHGAPLAACALRTAAASAADCSARTCGPAGRELLKTAAAEGSVCLSS